MIRKWEWIREYCKRQGFEESAEIADQIDRVLCYIYSGVNTREWKEYIDIGVGGITETGETDLSKGEVEGRIVRESSFCIACMIDGDNSEDYLCGHCRFDALTGETNERKSLYQGFCKYLNGGVNNRFADSFCIHLNNNLSFPFAVILAWL